MTLVPHQIAQACAAVAFGQKTCCPLYCMSIIDALAT